MPYYIILVRDNKNGMTNWYEFDDADDLLYEFDILKDNYHLKYVIVDNKLSAIDTWDKLFERAI